MSPTSLHVPMPLGAASREVYSQARAAGRGRQDWLRFWNRSVSVPG
ncbi:hypothetical protein ACLB1R_27885 [Escherichia coli]